MAETPEGERTAAERRFLPHHSKDWDGSSFPLSLPSQPPDIRNWFSSYVYESPESLCPPDGVGSDVLLIEEDAETECPVENSSVEERVLNDVPENGKRKLDSFMLDEKHCRASDAFCGGFDLPGAKKCLTKGIASSPERSLLRKGSKKQVSHQNHHPTEFNSHEQEDNYLAAKNKVDSIRGGQNRSSKSTFEEDLSDISRVPPIEEKDCSIWNQNTGNLQKRKVSLGKLLGEELLANQAEENGNSPFSMSSGRCRSEDSADTVSVQLDGIKVIERIDKTNRIRNGDVNYYANEEEDESHQEKHLSLNEQFEEAKETTGFISIKNKEKCRGGIDLSQLSIPTVKIEIMAPKTEITSQEKPENSNGASKEDQQLIEGNRSPTRDETDYQTVETAQQIPGKWQCPRRAKATKGPPMKQLRLDRWFHLLNCNSYIK